MKKKNLYFQISLLFISINLRESQHCHNTIPWTLNSSLRHLLRILLLLLHVHLGEVNVADLLIVSCILWFLLHVHLIPPTILPLTAPTLTRARSRALTPLLVTGAGALTITGSGSLFTISRSRSFHFTIPWSWFWAPATGVTAFTAPIVTTGMTDVYIWSTFSCSS